MFCILYPFSAETEPQTLASVTLRTHDLYTHTGPTNHSIGTKSFFYLTNSRSCYCNISLRLTI